ncbi:MAG: hypothetical protein K1X29_07845, partial [Bdellovibrionales bacterium]|nr:hypothetical protein [Bdellovibrionales bacterium]
MAVRYLENPFLRLSLKAISSLLVSIIFSTGCTLSTSIEDLASKVESTTPTVSISDTSFTEGSIGSFTVSLSQPTTLPVTVAYTMVDETATSPADYIGATGILTIPAGQSSGTVSINIVDDSVYEGNETFRFEISAVNNADMGPVTLSKQITITDNDSVPDISIADASVTEGGTLSFTVSLSHASKYPVTFDYVTQDGTGANKAVSPGDYTALSTTTATIPAGSLTTTLSVTTLQDSTYEQDELMNVVLSNPGTANIVDNTGVGTIVNDDTSPTFSISNVSATESQNVDFVIDISSPSEVPITFTWQTNDGTAVGGSDFTTQAPTLVTIPALTTQITLSVPTMNDSIAELSEQFSITVSGLTGATAGVVTATGTITDNDSDPFMWTGNAFPDTNWTTGANWYGGSAPNSSQTAIFNPVCAHCDAIVNSNISVGGIRFDVGYTGTVTQSSSQTITVGSSGWTQSSGNFAGSDANISVTGDVSVSGG